LHIFFFAQTYKRRLTVMQVTVACSGGRNSARRDADFVSAVSVNQGEFQFLIGIVFLAVAISSALPSATKRRMRKPSDDMYPGNSSEPTCFPRQCQQYAQSKLQAFPAPAKEDGTGRSGASVGARLCGQMNFYNGCARRMRVQIQLQQLRKSLASSIGSGRRRVRQKWFLPSRRKELIMMRCVWGEAGFFFVDAAQRFRWNSRFSIKSWDSSLAPAR